MSERPLSISIIAWILIVTGSISVVTTATNLNEPRVKELMERNLLPTEVQFAMLGVGVAVMVLSGVLILKGRNSGRWLYVAWNPIAFGVAMATSPMNPLVMLPGIIFYLIFAFLLFQPAANNYFAGLSSESPTRNPPASKKTAKELPRISPVRMVLSILCYVSAGFFAYMLMLIAFASEPPPGTKLSMLGVIAGFSFGSLFIGLWISEFRAWQRDTGIVFISSSLFTVFLVATIASMMTTPEFVERLPENKLDGFSDYVSGFGSIALYGLVGGMLLWLHRNQRAEES